MIQIVSYKRQIKLEVQLKAEVNELSTVGEQADQGEIQVPEGLILTNEIADRQERLANLAQAKKVLEERAQERYAAEKAEYDAKLREREEKARKRHQKPRGREPKPLEQGSGDKDQYNFTNPDSRIMKNSTNQGVDQHYNVQMANDQERLLIVACALSNHPNDKQEALPTFLSARSDRCSWRMAPGMPGFQSKTDAHLMASLESHLHAPATGQLKEFYP